jgi:hypothetical protein
MQCAAGAYTGVSLSMWNIGSHQSNHYSGYNQSKLPIKPEHQRHRLRAPLERKKEEGALLRYACTYYARPKLAPNTRQYFWTPPDTHLLAQTSSDTNRNNFVDASDIASDYLASWHDTA